MFDIINKYIYDSFNSVEQTKTHSIDVFYPSQASCKNLITGQIEGTCARNIFYKTKGYQYTNPSSSQMIRKMRYGNKIEEYEIDQLKAMDICVGNQTAFEIIYDTIKIKGKVDAIVKINDKFTCLEYKSSGGYYFKKQVMGSAYNNGFPKLSNLMQSMIYLDAFKNNKEFPFTECILMYIDREQCTTKEFNIQLADGYPVIDDDIYKGVHIKAIYERYKYLFKHLSLNILPPKDFRPKVDLSIAAKERDEGIITKAAYTRAESIGYYTDTMCTFCNYRDLCIKEEK